MKSLADPHARAEITQRLHALTPQDDHLWGEMSVNEMLCHLQGAFRAAMGELQASAPASRQPLPPRLMKFFALHMPMHWPKGVPTVPELKRGAPEMRFKSFEQERVGVLGTMERFLQPGQRFVDHAMFGAMSRSDWMRWGFLHTDHHLRQFGR